MTLVTHVGQQLWHCPRWHWRPTTQNGRVVTVEKIGRKWASLGVGWGRVDICTLRSDDPNGGRYFLSESHAIQVEQIARMWRALIERLTPIGPPERIGIADIQRFADLCGIALEPKQ